MNVDLSGLDPEAISALPALAPPHGVTPNFINPPSIENLAKGFIYTWLPIMVCFVGLRGYSRAKYSNGFGYDDCEAFPLFRVNSVLIIYEGTSFFGAVCCMDPQRNGTS